MRAKLPVMRENICSLSARLHALTHDSCSECTRAEFRVVKLLQYCHQVEVNQLTCNNHYSVACWDIISVLLVLNIIM